MSFCKAESNFADDTFSATGVDAVVAEVGETTSLPPDATEEEEEEAVEGVAPLANCPERKTWAALASFDLISCADAGVCAPLDEAADVDVADVEVAVSELPATGAAAAVPYVIWILAAKLPLHGGVPEAFTPR